MSPDTAAIFRTYDIRGIVGETFTEKLIFSIGRALAEELHEHHSKKAEPAEIVVGYDGRLSGFAMSQSLMKGLKQGGAIVKCIGMVPTPTTYLAADTHTRGSGVMVTGSHNPSQYNGCKMMICGETLAAERIIAIRERVAKEEFTNREGGSIETLLYLPDYQKRVLADVVLKKPLKIIIDCGNGVTGVIAKDLFTQLGCEVTMLFEEVDGHFPNHHPDPSQAENLLDIRAKMAEEYFDVGLAFDGDGDRVGVISSTGKVLAGDQLLMFFAKEVLATNPNAIILYDVKCTSLLAPWVKKHGGVPVMTRTGHALIKREIKRTGAKLAGEMSGHIFFNDRWPGFDDAIYAAARLLQMVANGADLDSWLAQQPKLCDTPEINVACMEGEQHTLAHQLCEEGVFDGADVNMIDGVRAEFMNEQGKLQGFGLVRPSNTTPVLVMRFEAVDKQTLQYIQAIFSRELRRIKPDINLPF